MRPGQTIQDVIQYHADFAKGFEEQFTPEHVVHGIYFGEGDPEQGGHHWSFTRDLSDDSGVCTVKGIQAATIYKGIKWLSLNRTRLECHFDDDGSQGADVRRLLITFSVDAETWGELTLQAQKVFSGELYAKIDEA